MDSSTPVAWEQRIHTQAAARTDHARRLGLAGFGQFLDPLLWPIIDRLWALGLPTTGSCQGHEMYGNPYGYPVTFVSMGFDLMEDAATRSRWHQLIAEFLTPQVAPGIVFAVTTLGLETRYLHYPPGTFDTLHKHALSLWCQKLDTVGRACLLREIPWEPWPGPALDVPAVVDFSHLRSSFAADLDILDPWKKAVIFSHIRGASWSHIAGTVHRSPADLMRVWDTFWSEWLAREHTALPVNPLASEVKGPAERMD